VKRHRPTGQNVHAA